MGCEGDSSRFCDTWKVNSKGILVKKNNTKLAMKVDAYLEQKNYNHLLVIAFLFLLRSCGALYQKCLHKNAYWLQPCPWEHSASPSERLEALEGRPMPLRDQKLKLPYLQSVGAPVVVGGHEWMVHWVEKLLPRVKGSWAHCGLRALPFQ